MVLYNCVFFVFNKTSTLHYSNFCTVASAPTNLFVVQQDLTATSIQVGWRHASSSTANEFLVLYNTEGENRTLTVPYCAVCVEVLSGLIMSASYDISIVALSDHLPSTVLGPENVDLGTDTSYVCCIYIQSLFPLPCSISSVLYSVSFRGTSN